MKIFLKIITISFLLTYYSLINSKSYASDEMTIEWEVMNELGTLGGQSYANAISADGSVIVGSSTDVSGVIHAVKFLGYDENGNLLEPEQLKSLDVNKTSYAHAISADGKIIVGQSYDDGVISAVKFTDDNGDVLATPEKLGALGEYSMATAISADGKIIVGYSYDGSSSNAVKFTDENGDVLDNPEELGTLGGNSYASAISADGSVIVGSSIDASGVPHAVKFLGYDENGNKLLEPEQLKS